MLSMGESRISAKEAKPELSAEIVINLPEEIIEAILLRLPVRSLLKLKCVCKSWYSLICSNYFIQAHLRISKECNNFDRRRVVFQDVSQSFIGEWRYSIKHFSFLPFSYWDWEVAEAVPWDIPMESPGFATILGVCNGLICVLVYLKYICLCNPSTREIRKLPDLNESGLSIVMFGFGFDEANEDYKVVCVIDLRHTTYPVSRVYSLKSNSWKQSETLKEYATQYDEDEGVFVSQRLHWIRRQRDNNRYEIASFDIVNEVWEKTEIPDFYGQGYCVMFGFGGCLSVLCTSPEHEVDVWVLKEYENRQSWKKLFHVPQFITRMLRLYGGGGQLVDGPNGTIVLLDNTYSDLITYDLKDNSFTREVRMNTDLVYQVHIFIESLVPLTRRHQKGLKQRAIAQFKSQSV